jgi:phage shock protein PspC (stress-responsive transcriptional regulator)
MMDILREFLVYVVAVCFGLFGLMVIAFVILALFSDPIAEWFERCAERYAAKHSRHHS